MNSKIVFDFDGVLTDYNQFIQKNAIGYFQKKYQMNIINADALEIEEIFDIQNVLKNLGYSEQEAIHIQEKMLNHFWISHRFIKYILLNRFRLGVSKYINYLRKQGFTIEIHSSRAKTCERNFVGMIARLFSIWQCGLNGIFLRRKQFFFYPDDRRKLNGILKSCPLIVFEDKPWIIERLANAGKKVICVSGTHNKAVLTSENVEIIHRFDMGEVDQKIEKLLGKSNFMCHKREACSAKFFKYISKTAIILRLIFRPIILHPENIISGMKEGIIYAPNHRSTLDPLVIESILTEPIHWAALARFFKGEDSIFNNNKNPVLCNITRYVFRRLEYFPVERKKDNRNASNMESLRDMNLFLKNGYKIGIFAEGTTKREAGEDFGTFDNSFLRLAKRNGSWVQPITLLWMKTSGINSRVVVNFGKAFQIIDMSIDEGMKCFMEIQRKGLEENLRI